jgi:hypothetical protein
MGETRKKRGKSEEVVRPGYKGQEHSAGAGLRLAAVGMEAEFNVIVDGEEVRPEDVFGDPRGFLEGPAMHRIGSSYSIPTGGAVYFDTGVIEVATPVIEISRGCMARAGRSLWESIGYVRTALDRWEARTGRDVRLKGFSTHYNVSFARPEGEETVGHARDRTIERLALLLTYILPPPVMMLAANKKSTGIGVRPRVNRIEITADFTPSAALMISAGTLIAGIARAVMRWPTYRLQELEERRLPVIDGFRPTKHTSRKGWLARRDCYPHDPFTTSPDDPVWPVEPWYFGDRPARHLSLREIAAMTEQRFRGPILSISDAFTERLIRAVLQGAAPSLLDLQDRPPEYDDVGRLCLWDDLFPERLLRRSRYERVLIRAIAGVPLRIDGQTYRPAGLKGWSEVIFRHDDVGLVSFPLDYLLDHLDTWERQ